MAFALLPAITGTITLIVLQACHQRAMPLLYMVNGLFWILVFTLFFLLPASRRETSRRHQLRPAPSLMREAVDG